MMEETSPHTGLLRVGLAVAASVAYWEKAPVVEPELRLLTAQEQHWFGEVSRDRTRLLLRTLEQRFPDEVVEELQRWRPQSQGQQTVVCHWHLQIKDPLYREFTSRVLLQQWSTPDSMVHKSSVLAWVESLSLVKSWSPSTRNRLASGLLSAATEAGLCQGSKTVNARQLCLPRVGGRSVAYLRELSARNGFDPGPYLASVGCSE